MMLPRMDERTLIRAAYITLRRAICERFPPGPGAGQAPGMARARSVEQAGGDAGLDPPETALSPNVAAVLKRAARRWRCRYHLATRLPL
jgi:hypothetical protein